jgi:6-phosphogluconolactonase (cycloisomerase 2 family)
MLLAFLVTLPLGAFAQSYVYVNNQSAANSVSGYSVSATGALTQLTSSVSPSLSSPFSTGGKGSSAACYGLNRIVLSAATNVLFVANNGDMTISSFTIAPKTGLLSLVVGAPFPSGLTADSCGGFSIAVTPDGSFLFAASKGIIQTFPVSATGVIGPAIVPAVVNPVSPNASMVISPDGKFLAVSNQTSVSVYTVTSGVLAPVAGSPFPRTGTSNLSGIDLSCVADRLYAGEATTTPTVDGWTMSAGVLTPAPGTPYKATTGNNSNVVALTPDNSLLIESNQFSNSLTTLTVNSNGSLTNVGKFGGTGTVHTPVGIAVDATGTFVFVADDAFGIATFRIGIGGALSSVSDVAINRPGQIHDLVVYPPKSCLTADLSLTMTASPASPTPVLPGAPITYTVTVTNNDANNTASLVVSDALPVGTTSGGNATIVASTGAARTSGISTITTTKPNGVTVGQSITIGGVANTSFNGNFIVASVISPTVFTYSQVATPPAVTPADATSGNGSVTYAACTVTGKGNTCGGLAGNRFATIPALGPNQSATITFSTTVNSTTLNGTTLTNTAVISNKSVVDPNPANNSATVTTVVNTPGATVLTAPTTTATFGGSATLTAILTNKVVSPATPTGISGETLTFTFAGNSYIGTTDASGTASVIVPLGTLAGGTHPSAFSVTFGGDATWQANGTTGTITVNPAQLLVTADNVSRTYGTPVAWASNTNFYVGEMLTDGAGNVQQVILSGTSGATLPTFSTVVKATTADGSVIWINRGPSTSAVNPPLTYTLSGFVNGDTSAVVTGTAACTTTAVATSPIGLYPVTCTAGTLAAPNYTIVLSNGTSSNSTLSVIPAPLQVVVANQTRTYGAADPAFTGTITGIQNGDAISATYASTDTATSPVGTYPIQPTLTGTLSNYNVIITNGVLTITGAPLTVTAANASRVYGDPNPTFTGSIVGLQNSETISVAYISAATQTSPVGSYAIVPVVTDPNNVLGNYILAIVNGTLTITQAPLTAAAVSTSRVYGDPNPAFTGVLTGLKNGDNITATFVSAATPASPVGVYAITPVFNDPNNLLPNYAVTSTGTLTITPAPLTVAAANASRVYGDPDPAFNGTLTGLKNNDPITATFVSAATPASPVGTYAITPVLSDPNGLLGNYTVTSTNGTLTVTPAPLAVQAADAAKAVGDPNPPFSGTITGLKNNDPISATYSSPADQTSPAGTYPITPALVDPNGLLGNYQITIINGTLTVS